MKPKNFPGRKMLRRIEAESRANGETVYFVLTKAEVLRVNQASLVRTKKRRVAA